MLRLSPTRLTLLVLPTDCVDLTEVGAVGFNVEVEDFEKRPVEILQTILSEAVDLRKLLDHQEGEVH